MTQQDKLSDTQQKIKMVTDSIREFLIEKNKRYGDSALRPRQIFCKADNVTQLMARLDDKIKRIENSNELRKNDTVDILGYLILVCIAKDWLSFDEFLD